MVSKYFERKTETESFKAGINDILSSNKDKKVILYGAGEGFKELNKKYQITKNLNIIAIADKKFETEKKDVTGLNQIRPSQIKDMDFDKIIITNEKPKSIKKYLINTLEIEESMIVQIFNEEIKDEDINLIYLYKHKFPKTIMALVKKLKGKTVMLYGTGSYLELILKYFDISGLNIIGVTDKKYEGHEPGAEFHGYKIYAPSEIDEIMPDYILVSTKYYVSIIEDLYYNTLKGKGIKIKPLVKKGFFVLLKEIWN